MFYLFFMPRSPEGERITQADVVQVTERQEADKAVAIENLFTNREFPLARFFRLEGSPDVQAAYIPPFDAAKLDAVTRENTTQTEKIQYSYETLARNMFEHAVRGLRVQQPTAHKELLIRYFTDARITNPEDITTILRYITLAPIPELVSTLLTENEDGEFDDTDTIRVTPDVATTSATDAFPIVKSDEPTSKEAEDELQKLRRTIQKIIKIHEPQAIRDVLYEVMHAEEIRLEQFKEQIRVQSEPLLQTAAKQVALESIQYHDVLIPKLYNKRGFTQELERIRTELTPRETAMVIYFDINNFRDINNNQGHDVGDTVLETIGNLLQQQIRPTDAAARLGGDEFCVVLKVPTDMVPKIQERITAAFGTLPPVGEVHIGVSGGLVTVSDADHTSFDELIQQAELAGFFRKLNRQSGIEHFDNTLITAFRTKFNADPTFQKEFIEQLARREFNRQVNAAESQSRSDNPQEREKGERKLVLLAKQIEAQKEIAELEIDDAQKGKSEKAILNKLFFTPVKP